MASVGTSPLRVNCPLTLAPVSIMARAPTGAMGASVLLMVTGAGCGASTVLLQSSQPLNNSATSNAATPAPSHLAHWPWGLFALFCDALMRFFSLWVVVMIGWEIGVLTSVGTSLPKIWRKTKGKMPPWR